MTAGNHPARPLYAVRGLALRARLVAAILPGAFAVGVPLPTVRRLEVQPWSAAELAQFLRQSSTDRLGPALEVIAACGPPRGEALGCAGSTSTCPAVSSMCGRR